MRHHRHLVIFCKEPVAGRVKSRLARSVGVTEATRCQRVLLSALLRRLGGDARWTTWLAVAPDTALASPLLPAGPRRIAQGQGDLGARMQRVFDRLPPGPAVIIGSDIPGIKRGHIDGALSALGRRDAVIGPSPDGGYWLIGLARRGRLPRPFGGVRWSTEHARADTVNNLKGYNYSIIQLLMDVDDDQAWRHWRRGTLNDDHAEDHAGQPDRL